MRILHICPGIDTPTRMLYEGLAARSDICSEMLTSNAEMLSAVKDLMPYSEFHSRGKLDLLSIRRLRAMFRQGNYDIVHAMSSRTLANSIVASMGLPNPPKLIGFVGFIGRFSRWNPTHRITYLHPRVTGVHCNCIAAGRPLAEAGVAKSKLFAIHAGQPCRPQRALPDLQVRSELGIPGDAMVVAFAGNMRPVKGVDLLLEAAIDLAERRQESIHWLLIGRVQDKRVEELLRHPAYAGQVHTTGWRTDAERLLTVADIFAMPSRSEGFSRAIMEAMELGLCPVATAVGGTPELVRDGTDGLIVPPNDAPALAQAIGRLANDSVLRQQMAKSSRQRIEQTFTIERMVDRTVEMYHSVLGQQSNLAKHAA